MHAEGKHSRAAICCQNVWLDPPGKFAPAAVRIEKGRIDSVLALAEAQDDGAWPEVNFRTEYLMPGMINTHVHLELSASSRPRAELEAECDAERLVRSIGNARTLLQSGVTTARDCGSSFSTLSLARRPDLHPVTLPRLVLCGPPITRRRGHMHDFGGEAEQPDEIASLIERLVENGAGSIKLMGSGGGMTPGTLPEQAAYPYRAFSFIAGRAREFGLASAAHVLAGESVRRAAKARFDSLEHCAFFERDADGRLVRRFDPEIADTVAASGASIMPNLSTATRSHPRLRCQRDSGCRESAHELAQFDQMIENFGRLSALGIPMVCGTDAGVRDTGFSDTWRELVWMARGGLTNLEAIRAASVNAASVLRHETRIGRIAPGFRADFVVLKRSPIDDLAAYRMPTAVLLGGREVAPLAECRGSPR